MRLLFCWRLINKLGCKHKTGGNLRGRQRRLAAVGGFYSEFHCPLCVEQDTTHVGFGGLFVYQTKQQCVLRIAGKVLYCRWREEVSAWEVVGKFGEIYLCLLSSIRSIDPVVVSSFPAGFCFCLLPFRVVSSNHDAVL